MMSEYQPVNTPALVLEQMGFPVGRIPMDGITLEAVDGSTYTFVWDEYVFDDDGQNVRTLPNGDVVRTSGHRAKVTLEFL